MKKSVKKLQKPLKRRSRLIDRTGKTYGKIHVLSYAGQKEVGPKKKKTSSWNIRCDECSMEKVISNGRWLFPEKLSGPANCGCLKYNKKGFNHPRFKNIVGKRFGKLTVLEYCGSVPIISDKNPRTTKTYYTCKCDCGNIKKILRGGLTSGNTKSCGCVHRTFGAGSHQWSGTKDVSKAFITSIKSSAKKRGLEMSLKIEDIQETWEKQNKQCALTGLPIDFGDVTKKTRSTEVTASVDRINSLLGYTKENIQIVHKDLNTMKFDYSQNYFIEMCKLVAKNN